MSRISAIASVALGALALAACSGAPDKAETTETTTTTTVVENAATPAEAPAAAVAYASLTGDAAKGEKIFLQCKACHVLEEGQNRVGPSLHGIIGRTAGQVAGYSYSTANKNSGYTWTEDQLYTYLEAPQKAIPGTKMTFVGLKKPQDRADVIAYLKTAS